MKLIKLSSNKESFRPVLFNENGISLVTARKKSNLIADTYNSVGKSLMIYLIHFCLGSKSNKELQKKLAGWTFRLDFKIDDDLHYVSRSTDKQEILVLDGIEYKYTDFNKKLGNLVFKLDEISYMGLSFRSLISRYIREGKNGYVRFDKFKGKEQEDVSLLSTSYLLGLDAQMVRAKIDNREKTICLQNEEKTLKNDSVIKSVLLDGLASNRVAAKMINLERDIEKIERDIKNYKIAEDYNQIKQEADFISKKIKEKNALIGKYQIVLDNIEKSMAKKIDITKSQLVSFYKEVEVELNDKIIKRLEDVELFNKKLIDDRNAILANQKMQYEKKIMDCKKDMNKLFNVQNEKMQYLNSHGALDDFSNLTKILSDKKNMLDSLKKFDLACRQIKLKKEQLKRIFAEENEKTQQYLDNEVDKTNDLLRHFITYAQKLYGEQCEASFKVENNTGNNKIRFNIDVNIPKDAGGGVNASKLFCFDLTLFHASYGKGVDFIVHDSSLLSEIDTRQVATMFQIASEECACLGTQYIVALNDSLLNDLEKEMDPNDYKHLITDNIILELNDESDTEKLLGVYVDLKYE